MPTDSEDHKRTVQRYPRAVAAGDFDILREIYTENVVNHTPLAEPRGYAALIEYERRIHEALPGFKVTFEDLVANDDRVAIRFTINGTHQGSIMGIESMGIQVEFGNPIFHRLDGDLLAERWVQPDVFGLLTQIGAVVGAP